MPRTLDARGLLCPMPAVMARAALARLAREEVLVVLATDPEAPIDLAAVAADHRRRVETLDAGGHWRITLGPAR
jgi:tRNA 2-thiouridine synthesizing protein A